MDSTRDPPPLVDLCDYLENSTSPLFIHMVHGFVSLLISYYCITFWKEYFIRFFGKFPRFDYRGNTIHVTFKVGAKKFITKNYTYDSI